MLLGILHPHVIIHDPTMQINVELITEECGVTQLSHERLSELIKSVR